MDPDPPPEKTKKKWDPLDTEDPNWSINSARAQYQQAPIDFYNMGYEYYYDGNIPSLFLTNIDRKRFMVISYGQ